MKIFNQNNAVVIEDTGIYPKGRLFIDEDNGSFRFTTTSGNDSDSFEFAINWDLVQDEAGGTFGTIELARTYLAGVVGMSFKPSDQSVVSSGNVTPDGDTNDIVIITAQAEALTLDNPTGSPSQGQPLSIRIKDDGTPRSISYDTEYRAIGITLPVTTVANKTTYIDMVYNATDSKWDCKSTVTES